MEKWNQDQVSAYEAIVAGKYMPAFDWIHRKVSAASEPLHAKRVMETFFIERDERTEEERQICRRAAAIMRKREAQLGERHAKAMSILDAESIVI